MAQEKGTKPPLPKFRSLEEEAEFWETHSPFDFEGWKEVRQFKVARPLRHVLGLRLDAKTIDRLAEIGGRMGIGPSTLARIWIMERLSQVEVRESSVESRAGQRKGVGSGGP